MQVSAVKKYYISRKGTSTIRNCWSPEKKLIILTKSSLKMLRPWKLSLKRKIQTLLTNSRNLGKNLKANSSSMKNLSRKIETKMPPLLNSQQGSEKCPKSTKTLLFWSIQSRLVSRPWSHTINSTNWQKSTISSRRTCKTSWHKTKS